MEISSKQQIIIKVLCIVILLGLNIAVFIHGRNLSCDKCKIEFTSEKITHEEAFDSSWQEITINITDLYDSYLNDQCIIKFDPIEGYKYGKI